MRDNLLPPPPSCVGVVCGLCAYLYMQESSSVAPHLPTPASEKAEIKGRYHHGQLVSDCHQFPALI